MNFELSNRETAMLICVAVFILVMMWRYKSVRRSLQSVGRQALKWKLASTALLGWAWISLGVALLSHVGFWEVSLMKETVLWALLPGTAIAFRGLGKEDPNDAFRSVVSDQLKLSALIVFYANLRALPLLGELLLIPSMAIIGVSMAIAEGEDRFAILRQPLQGLASLVGFALLIFVSIDVFANPAAYFTTATLKSLLMPPLLIGWAIPFGYGVGLIGAYEVLWVRQKVGGKQPPDLRFYSMLKAFELAGFNAGRVGRMTRLMAGRARWAKSHEELDDLYSALRETLLDPDNKDSRDFMWPKAKPLPGEVRFGSLGEYLEVATPVFEQSVDLWLTTVETFQRTSGGGEPPPDLIAPSELEAFLRSGWPTAEHIDRAINDINLPPEAGIRFDRELESFCAELQQIFWYYSPENTSCTQPPRRGYLVFSSYRSATKQFDRLILAAKKLTASN
ncbi:hypothetical protein HAHE_25070 [Haloferula helveola]|uniref:Uncharacterized protein n=1 Tax=Haloferula helveola TaxID=490095 RepID=A0ABN6H7H6_9BACT|nr:hypothetical protein HAHE_25070 [Haloferula helveola]